MNKFLVTIIVPTIEMEFEVFIPNNKKIGTIKKYILKSVKELSNNNFEKTEDSVKFIDRETNKEFPNDIYVKDSDLKNGSIIVII